MLRAAKRLRLPLEALGSAKQASYLREVFAD
jgi:hypothetical protein